MSLIRFLIQLDQVGPFFSFFFDKKILSYDFHSMKIVYYFFNRKSNILRKQTFSEKKFLHAKFNFFVCIT